MREERGERRDEKYPWVTRAVFVVLQRRERIKSVLKLPELYL